MVYKPVAWRNKSVEIQIVIPKMRLYQTYVFHISVFFFIGII